MVNDGKSVVADRIRRYRQRIDSGLLTLGPVERRDGTKQGAGLRRDANALTGGERSHLHLEPCVRPSGKGMQQPKRRTTRSGSSANAMHG